MHQKMVGCMYFGVDAKFRSICEVVKFIFKKSFYYPKEIPKMPGDNNPVQIIYSMLLERLGGDLHLLPPPELWQIKVRPVGQDGQTALHNACFYGRYAEVKRLEMNGANVNAVTEGGASPLHFAVFKCELNVVDYLLSRGANIEVMMEFIGNPLHLAAAAQQANVARLLLSKGADVNAACESGGNFTALHCALQGTTDEELFKLLLDYGANINAPDGFGDTPLHIAVTKSNYVALDLLLKRGADMEVLDETVKETPLLIAIKEGNLMAVKLLLEHDADPNTPNGAADAKSCPLLYAANARICEENSAEIFKLLLAAGANIDARDGNNSTVVHQAAYSGNYEVLEILSQHPNGLANRTCRTGDQNRTAFHNAAQSPGASAHQKKE
mmetsp:Transcript_15176/g.25302  ORF Transcript_15176/g.25302 Transcript_15176/m.25302 type:complete len:384 (+) Transcript_15176:375-1526(+)